MAFQLIRIHTVYTLCEKNIFRTGILLVKYKNTGDSVHNHVVNKNINRDMVLRLLLAIGLKVCASVAYHRMIANFLKEHVIKYAM